MSGGRHRHRLLGDRAPRGLRPLTVVALCCVVAVLAVLATQATHPYGDLGGSGQVAAAGGGSRDPGTDDGTPASDDPSLATDPASDNTSDPPAPADPPDSPAPAPAPAVPNAADPPPAPVPVPVPVPDPSTPSPIPVPTTPSPTPSPSPAPPPGPVSFEAESSTNTLTGTRTYSCAPCSGGKKVGDVGKGGVLQFNNVVWGNGGTALIVLSYLNGDTGSRSAQVSVNGSVAVWFSFKSTSNWSNVGTLTLKVTLRPGANRITIANPGAYGPDFDRITVRAP